MSHINQGPLATYNSLTDHHLNGYFANDRLRRHLQKSGLVKKNGEIVSETTYRLSMSRKEHKKQIKDMLAQAIVHRTLDLERSRQAEIKTKLEEISKIQLVRRMRATREKKGDEDILPLLTPRSSDANLRLRWQSPRTKFFSRVMPHARAESCLSEISVENEGDVLYLDDEGYPITPFKSDCEHLNLAQEQIDTRHLHSLDSVALRKYATLMAEMEHGRGVFSPYLMPQIPLPPKTPITSHSPRNARRIKQPALDFSGIAHLHPAENAKPHPGEQQTMCHIKMRYHGWALNLAREQMDPTQDVAVEQQHCGGNPLTVFRDKLLPECDFEFISYRHRGYPFSLTLYVDGKMDSRISTCCEYRHSCGAKIGGRKGHFSILSVDGALPCYKCQVEKGVLKRHKAQPKKLKRPSEHHAEEVIIVSSRHDNKDKHDAQKSQSEDDKKGKSVLVDVERGNECNEEKITYEDKKKCEDDFDESKSFSSASNISHISSSFSSSSSSSSESDDDEETHQIDEDEITCMEDQNKSSEQGQSEPPKIIYENNSTTAGTKSNHWAKHLHQKETVNGTGRGIDEYSSDEDRNENKVNILFLRDLEGNGGDVKQKSPSAIVKCFDSDSFDSRSNKQEEKQAKLSLIMKDGNLDYEEHIQNKDHNKNDKHKEIHQKEEENHIDERKTEELKWQEAEYKMQKQGEKIKEMKEHKQLEENKNNHRRTQSYPEENNQMKVAIQPDEKSREEELILAQKKRDVQILEEQRLREEKWKANEQVREQAWLLDQARWGEEKRREEVKTKERKIALKQSNRNAQNSIMDSYSELSENSSSSNSILHRKMDNTQSESLLKTDTPYFNQMSTPLQKQDFEAAVVKNTPTELSENQMDMPMTKKENETFDLLLTQTHESDTSYASSARSSSSNSNSSSSSSSSDESELEINEEVDEEDKHQAENRDEQSLKMDIEQIPSRMLTAHASQPVTNIYETQKGDKSPEPVVDEIGEPVESKNEDVKEIEKISSSSSSLNSISDEDDGKKSEDNFSERVQDIPESDFENMHGGADPDNVSHDDKEKILLHPLKTQEVPEAKVYEGNIKDLLTRHESVELSNVLLNKAQVYELASYIKESTAVKNVSLCNTGLDDDDLQQLAESLQTTSSQVKMLNLSLNSLTEDSVQHILQILKAKPSIKLLILQSNPIRDEGVHQIVSGLLSLQNEVQSHHKIDTALAGDTISMNSSVSRQNSAPSYILHELDLANTELTDMGAKEIAYLLSSNIHISSLVLNANKDITADEGWKVIGEALSQNHYLTTLCLDGNIIGDDGMSHIANGMHKNKTLATLTLEDTSLGERGGVYILEMLKRNTTITELTLLPGNSIPDQLLEEVHKYISLNRTHNSVNL